MNNFCKCFRISPGPDLLLYQVMTLNAKYSRDRVSEEFSGSRHNNLLKVLSWGETFSIAGTKRRSTEPEGQMELTVHLSSDHTGPLDHGKGFGLYTKRNRHL